MTIPELERELRQRDARIKEQDARIKEQAARIAELQREIEELKKLLVEKANSKFRRFAGNCGRSARRWM